MVELKTELKEKYERLQVYLKPLGRLAVAYSGGIDSTFLLYAAAEALGRDNALGIIADSETLSEDELRQATEVAQQLGFRMHGISYSELEIENYAENPVNRCYFCRDALFSRVREAAAELGFAQIADGSIYDDLTSDYRPGMRAASEQGVLSPLLEVQLRKVDIRALARAFDVPNWGKPSGACLSSRFPYGTKITRERLEQVGAAEKVLHDKGFRQVRVRWHDQIARIEVGPDEMDRLLESAMRVEITERLRSLGFRYITLDLLGYRTGSLNEGLRLSANNDKKAAQ